MFDSVLWNLYKLWLVWIYKIYIYKYIYKNINKKFFTKILHYYSSSPSSSFSPGFLRRGPHRAQVGPWSKSPLPLPGEGEERGREGERGSTHTQESTLALPLGQTFPPAPLNPTFNQLHQSCLPRSHPFTHPLTGRSSENFLHWSVCFWTQFSWGRPPNQTWRLTFSCNSVLTFSFP